MNDGYGFAVTDAGRYLIARLLTGDTMHITKIMFGDGRVPDGVRLASVTGLYNTVAQGTSDDPQCDRGTAYMTVEYNNALNGGLESGFWLREFGIFALDPANGEVLIGYGTLGDYAQYVAPYAQNVGIDVRRFPVEIAIGEDRGMVVDYKTSLWMTAEDVRNYFNTTLLPLIDEEIDEKIAAHNRDPEAHFGMERILNLNVYPRLALAEAMEELSGVSNDEHIGYENEYITVFDTLDDVDMTSGNWNDLLCRVEF